MPNKGNAPARTPTCHPAEKHIAKGLCEPCYNKARAQKNPERRRALQRKWAKENPHRVRAAHRKYLYGIDQATFEARLKAQDGLCKICQAKPGTDIDHNHATGKTRGVLCGDCNRALGLFRENPESLARAIAYLELWDDRAVQVRMNTGEPVGYSTRGNT